MKLIKDICITKNALMILRTMDNLSFIFIEKNKVIVDFASSLEEVETKCKILRLMGIKHIRFHETSVKSINDLLEASKTVMYNEMNNTKVARLNGVDFI